MCNTCNIALKAYNKAQNPYLEVSRKGFSPSWKDYKYFEKLLLKAYVKVTRKCKDKKSS